MSSEIVAIGRATIAKHSKSFSLAARLLTPGMRDEASIVYAWCRRADDAIDFAPREEQASAVQSLRRELESIYDGDAQAHPILAGFQQIARPRSIPRAYPEELLAGMQMDASGTIYRSYEDLLAYCYRVAGTVGLMMSHVMGLRDAKALRNAAHLGMAMQLTNVCRDVREDWDRGRLYLPHEMLCNGGAGELRERLGQSFPLDARAAIAQIIRELLRRAELLYASGDRGIPFLSWRSAIAVRTARLVYSDIGRVLLARGGDPLAPRAVVSRARKLVLATRALVTASTLALQRFEPCPLDQILGLQDVVSP